MNVLPAQAPQSVWHEMLPFDVAMMDHGALTLDELLHKYTMSIARLQVLLQNDVFIRQVQDYHQQIVEHGLTFRFKARALAESLLGTAFNIATDPMIAGSARVDMIKSLVTWGDLVPPKKVGEAGESGPGVSIVINMGGERKVFTGTAERVDDASVIEHQPENEE